LIINTSNALPTPRDAPLPHNKSQGESEEEKVEVEQILKINDKFKFALRNIAEKQKHTNIYGQLQSNKRKQTVKSTVVLDQEVVKPMVVESKPSSNERSQKYYISDHLVDDSLLKSLEQHQNVGPEEREMEHNDFIDVSKLTIEIDDRQDR
jgi:hypothetical protein